MNEPLFNVLDLMLRMNLVTEGVFKSYNANIIFKKLLDYFTLFDAKDFDTISINNFNGYAELKKANLANEITLIQIVLFFNNKELKNKINKFFEICGWNLSLEKTNNEYEVILQYVKNRQEQETKVPQYLYHLTLKKNLSKILRNGLVPKSGNKNDNHLEKIYFFTEFNPAEFKNLLRQFLEYEKLNGDTEYSVLEIDTKKLNNNIKFYEDPQLSGGLAVWCFDNIPPTAISVKIKELKLVNS